MPDPETNELPETHAGVLDLLVVGGGPAGTAAAFRAKELGLSALVIDQDDVLTRIRDYAKDKSILPDFGGGDKMRFPTGGDLIADLNFEPIDKDDMHQHWRELYTRHSVPFEVGVELTGLETDEAGVWRATTWNSSTKNEESLSARHVVLALGGGMPRRLSITGDVKSIAPRLADAAAYVGSSVCVIGGGTSSAEAVIAIAHAKAEASDETPVCWAYRGTKMPAVSRALADDLFAAYTQCGNIRYMPGAEPVAVTERSDQAVLCVEVDRRELPNRPTEVVQMEFLARQCIACIGQEIPEKFLGALGVAKVTGGSRNKKAMVVSPLLETRRPNLYLIGDTLSPFYLETDDFDADPADFREIKRRGNVKAALRDGVLVAGVVAQKIAGKTSIHVDLGTGEAEPAPAVAARKAPAVVPPAITTRGAFLVSLLRDGVEAEEFPLTAEATSLGRQGTDVSFPDDSLLSERHATISKVADGYAIRDDGSQAGVFLRVSDTRPMPVSTDGVVNAGRQWLVFSATGDPRFKHYDPTGRMLREYPLREGTLVLGRDAPDVTLDGTDETLSRRHVSVTLKGGEMLVRDLKSVNGTYLKVTGSRKLEDGDEIRIGSQILRFTLAQEARPAMTVSFDTTAHDIAKPAEAEAAAKAEPAPRPAAASAPPAAAPQGLSVVFQNSGKQCAFKKGQSLCEVAEANGVKMQAQCHEGRCGSDPIRIVSGQEHLNKVTDLEESTLEECGLEAGEYRLACVTRPTGPVVVEVVDP
jgi:thioredoxin reductase/ferredoxin